MSGTNTINSDATNIENLDNVGYEVSWSGTPIGTISVQCSVDGNSYFDLTFDPVLAQPAGSSGGYLINLNQVPFKWVRVSYTNTSGAGALTVKIIGKDIN